MDDRLRVHHRVEPLGRDAKQMMRLDEFEPLVHQAGRVDRHLPAHRPIGVGQRLRDRRRLDARLAPKPKRPARGGDGHFGDLRRVPPAQRLENRVMLRVHRQDARAAARRLRHDERAGADDRLLIGHGDRPPRRNRRIGGRQAGRADDAGNHHLRRASGGRDDGVLAAGDLNGVAGDAGLQRLISCGVGQRGERRL